MTDKDKETRSPASGAMVGYDSPKGEEYEWDGSPILVEGPEPYDMDDPADRAEVVRRLRNKETVPVVSRPVARVGRDGRLYSI